MSKDSTLCWSDEKVIANNPAFIRADAGERDRFAPEYRKTQALCYQGQPDFGALMARIRQHIHAM